MTRGSRALQGRLNDAKTRQVSIHAVYGDETSHGPLAVAARLGVF